MLRIYDTELRKAPAVLWSTPITGLGWRSNADRVRLRSKENFNMTNVVIRSPLEIGRGQVVEVLRLLNNLSASVIIISGSSAPSMCR